jgi:3-methylcrotonyl-CoA carboxylase alpha subunit
VSVLIDGAAHLLLMPDPLAVAAHHGEHGDAILAPMTGIVRAVTVREGVAVDKGDRLIVMEAMKMETSLTAPRAGLVAEVFCAEGETVEGGAVLVRFEETGP